jgi:hypothetical protein
VWGTGSLGPKRLAAHHAYQTICWICYVCARSGLAHSMRAYLHLDLALPVQGTVRSKAQPCARYEAMLYYQWQLTQTHAHPPANALSCPPGGAFHGTQLNRSQKCDLSGAACVSAAFQGHISGKPAMRAHYVRQGLGAGCCSTKQMPSSSLPPKRNALHVR